jgi:hypothetical protein
MIHTKSLPAAFALLVAVAAPTVEAAPIIHDSVAEFSVITFAAGTNFPAADVTRNSVANMFDGNATGTFLSLGIGGDLQLTISPAAGRAITSGIVIERTNASSGHVETVQVYLGINGGGWLQVGSLLNSQNAGGASVVDLGAAADLSFANVGSGTTARTVYNIFNIAGTYNSIRFLDTSPFAAGRDGFDIAELKVTSVSVPEPTALTLIGISLLGAGIAGRRRRSV